MNRRALTAALAAIPAGIAGGMLVRHWTATDGASIRFIGQRDTMIALFDSGNERALFLIGEPDSRVLEHLPQLLTFGRTRVDLLIASHRWLTADGIRSAIDLETTATLSLQANTSVPPISGNVLPVTDSYLVKLGEIAEITISVSPDVGDEPNDPLTAIEIRANDTRLLVANREPALWLTSGRTTLLAAPGDIAVESIETISPSVFVGTALYDDAPFEQLLVYYNEPISLAIGDGTLTFQPG